jgi:hypothetical protein
MPGPEPAVVPSLTPLAQATKAADPGLFSGPALAVWPQAGLFTL